MTTTLHPAGHPAKQPIQHLILPGKLHLSWFLTLAASIALHLRLRTMLFDDACIHLRIARNLLLHGHPFFNPAEPVMVTSSPLWTILLATLHIPSHPVLLPILQAVLLTLAACLVHQLAVEEAAETVGLSSFAKRRTCFGFDLPAQPARAAAATVLILLPSTVGGMETPLAITLLLGAACTFRSNRTATLPLLALAACTRLELLPILLAAAIAHRKQRRPLAIAAAILLLTAAATYTQFHTLLPSAMHAKSIGYACTRMQIFTQLIELPALSLFLTAAVATTIFAARRQPMPLLAIFTGLLIALEYLVQRTPIFDWYRPLYTLPILLGVLLYRPQSSRTKALRLATAALILSIPGYHTARLLAAAIRNTPAARWSADRGDSQRVAQYLAVGRTLYAACPAATLMSSEIGALGWAFPGHISDAFGIATPAALAFQPLHSGAPVAGIPAAFAARVHPDLIVSYTTLDAELRNDPALLAQYRLLQLPAGLPGSNGGWHGSTHLDVFAALNSSCSIEPEQASTGSGTRAR